MKKVIIFAIAGVLFIAAGVGAAFYLKNKDKPDEEAVEALEQRMDNYIIATPNWPIYSVCQDLFPNAEVRWQCEYDQDVTDIIYDIDQEADINLYVGSACYPTAANDKTFDVSSGFMEYKAGDHEFMDSGACQASYMSIGNARRMISNICELCQDHTYTNMFAYHAMMDRIDAIEASIQSDKLEEEHVFDVCRIAPLCEDIGLNYYCYSSKSIAEGTDKEWAWYISKNVVQYSTDYNQTTKRILYDLLRVPESIGTNYKFLDVIDMNLLTLLSPEM